jgi:hypothetical protein
MNAGVPANASAPGSAAATAAATAAALITRPEGMSGGGSVLMGGGGVEHGRASAACPVESCLLASDVCSLEPDPP